MYRLHEGESVCVCSVLFRRKCFGVETLKQEKKSHYLIFFFFFWGHNGFT